MCLFSPSNFTLFFCWFFCGPEGFHEGDHIIKTVMWIGDFYLWTIPSLLSHYYCHYLLFCHECRNFFLHSYVLLLPQSPHVESTSLTEWPKVNMLSCLPCYTLLPQVVPPLKALLILLLLWFISLCLSPSVLSLAMPPPPAPVPTTTHRLLTLKCSFEQTWMPGSWKMLNGSSLPPHAVSSHRLVNGLSTAVQKK